MATYISLLRTNSNYNKLWMAQAISFLGDWFSTIALSTLVSTYSNESGLAISLFLLCRFLPPLIVGPLAGVMLDRFDRRRFLIASDVLRVFIVLGFLLANSPGRLWIIYLFTVLQFAVSAFFEPGRNALLPSLLESDTLVQANMLGGVTWSVMSAVGGALGGLVAGTLGIATALVIDSSTFAISALLIAHITPGAPHPGVRIRTTIKPLADFLDSVRTVRQRPTIATTLLVKGGSSLGSMDTLMIVYATALFAVGDRGAVSLGILWAGYGMGAVLGPFIFEPFNDGSITRMRRFILTGFALITVGWLIFAGAPVLAVAALGLLVKAIGGTNWTYSSVILQKITPDEYLGRVFSLDMIVFQASLVIGIIATGVVVDVVGAEHVRAVVIGTALISLLPLALWLRALRWFEHHEEAR
jgi:NRE family putative nickel resistance protein-like MFS transporter